MLKFAWSSITSAEATSYVQQSIDKDPEKSRFLAGPLICENCSLGEISPVIQIKEISHMTEKRIEMTFAVEYLGDARIALRTQVQANLATLLDKEWPESLLFAKPKMASLTSKSLVVPLSILISKVKLQAEFHCAADINRGVVLVAKPEPKIEVEASSSLESVPGVEAILIEEILHKMRIAVLQDVPLAVREMTEKADNYKILNEKIHEMCHNEEEQLPIFVPGTSSTPPDSPDSSRFSPSPGSSGYSSLDGSPLQNREHLSVGTSNSFEIPALETPPPYKRHSSSDVYLTDYPLNMQTLSLNVTPIQSVSMQHLIDRNISLDDEHHESEYVHTPRRRVIRLKTSSMESPKEPFAHSRNRLPNLQLKHIE